MSYVLRPYQAHAINALWNWFRRHETGNPIMAAAVGAGKSIMIAEIVRHAMTEWPGTRVLMVVASKELLEQNLGKLFAIWPEAPAGICSAALARRDVGYDLTYATIGSIWRRGHELGRVDLVLVDECHQIGPNNASMYRTLIAELARFNPELRVIGWTGTPFRGDGIWLTDAEEPLFHGIAARVTMRELLDLGFLASLRTAATATQFDASDVALRGGDYVVAQLAQKLDQAALIETAVAELVELGRARQRWLVYCVTVAHAEHVCAALRAHGVDARVVSAETPAAERSAAIGEFRAGQLRAIVNVAVLTTGFDVPEVDLIALLRNTRSPVLYQQIAGRGMRVATGKVDCLWVDFTDTTAVLGPVDAVTGRPRPPRTQPGAAPFKVCITCGSQNPTAAVVCIDCGAEFPPPERVNHRDRASTAAVLSGGAPQREQVAIDSVRYVRHSKEGRPDSLRVEYWSGISRVAQEWVCLEHGGYAGERASHWWRRRSQEPVPRTVTDALARRAELLPTTALVVSMGGKWNEIEGYVFDEPERTASHPNGFAHDARAA